MSDHAGPLRFGTHSVKKTLFDGLFTNLGLREFLRLVGSLFGHSSILVLGRENHHPAGIAAMNPIDISSSDDSDFGGIDEYVDELPLRDSAMSSISRILPP